MRKGKKHTTSLSQDCERGLDSREVKYYFFLSLLLNKVLTSFNAA